MTEEYDYIIAGAGSAGSVLAEGLSADPRNRVLVLEAGGRDDWIWFKIPVGYLFAIGNPRADWRFETQPEPGLAGRKLNYPRGKVIGGSSSINGLVYVRGHAEDFNRWEELGARGWAYADVLPYFKRMEHSHGGEAGWRGTDGPLHVKRGPVHNPLFHAFIKAGEQAGFELTDDYNGSKQEGFGLMEQTVWQGRRWSAANAYLKPAMKRQNVSLVRCFARRIILENGRATGVEIERGGKIEIVKANREVVVSASSFNSPKLLML